MRAELTTEPELGSSIHRNFRESHEGHKPHAGLDPSRSTTGVVWTSEQAYKHGFADHPDEWANLGQGAPEVDDSIEGCFEVRNPRLCTERFENVGLMLLCRDQRK